MMWSYGPPTVSTKVHCHTYANFLGIGTTLSITINVLYDVLFYENLYLPICLQFSEAKSNYKFCKI